jgi:hypothetical protein
MSGRLSILAVLGFAALSACTPHQPREVIKATGKVRFRSIVEPSAVSMMIGVEGALLGVTAEGMLRWNDAGEMLALNADQGLSGHVVAMARTVDSAAAWLITDGGIGRYDVAAGAIAELPAPTAVHLDVTTFRQGKVFAAGAADGGLWLGTEQGLFYASAKGGWVSMPVKIAIHGLALDRDGNLWVATDQGLMRRESTGSFTTMSASNGCTLAKVIQVITSTTMGVVAVGLDGKGIERLAIGSAAKWQTFSLQRSDGASSPITGIADGDRELTLLSNNRLYRVLARVLSDQEPTAADTLTLDVVSGAKPAAFSIVASSAVAPAGATTITRWKNSIVVGTRELGIAQLDSSLTKIARWFRRGQMFVDATTLSVACRTIDDCWIATGARKAWHTEGERFVAGGPDNVVLLVIRDPNGEIYAFHRAAFEKSIHVAKIVGDQWTEIPDLLLQLPGESPEISFAKFDAQGQLWVGLRFREAQEFHPWGVATMNIAAPKINYHRTTNDAKLRPTMLPIPVGVMDGDLSGKDAWFATSEGVARLRNNDVTVWNEANGLQSEFIRAIAVAPNGNVFTATSTGLGIFDHANNVWDFPKLASFAITDVVLDVAGAPWMATERGLATMLDNKVKRLDTRAGLVENRIDDLAVDHLGRIWARSPGSLTVVETGK